MESVIARQIPNALSLLRILLILPLLDGFYSGNYRLALLCFLVIGLSDFFDGYLARHYDWVSSLGGILDPVADKLAMLAGYFMLADGGLIPWWLFALVVGRDLLIVCGTLVCRLLLGAFEMQPSLISKLNTAVALSLVVLHLFSLAWMALPSALLQACTLLVALTCVLSGGHYLLIWGHKVLSGRV